MVQLRPLLANLFAESARRETMIDPRTENKGLLVRVEQLPPLHRLEPIWRDLEARAKPSFFLSWHWIGTWLAASGFMPALLVASNKDVVVGLALVGQDCPRFGPLRLPRIHLNQAGAVDLDCVCIEYNDLLLDCTNADATRAACLTVLSNCLGSAGGLEWREMCWAASALAPENMPLVRNLVIETNKISPSPYVDLDAVRGRGSDLCQLLSANARRQIRRSIRLYEAIGKLGIERASTKEEAVAWLDALRRFHQASWISRGEAGAFARPFFGRFLQQLIERGFSDGAVDILRVSAGQYELGYLCNFVYRDRVSNYQTGFRFGPTAHYKPGLVAHALAVQHYARNDSCLRKYSFLVGAAQYKATLSTGSEELRWYSYRPASRLLGLHKAIGAIVKRLSSR